MAIPPPPKDETLRSLGERADALARSGARSAGKQPDGVTTGSAAVNQGYRIIADLLAGVIVGLALGFGLDRLTHGATAPWGLIGGVLLGFAVSVWMARQTANRLMAQAARENGGAPAPSVPFDDDED